MGFRWGQAFALLLLAVLAGGCAPLPNVDPFVDASSQLRSAIITSGAAVEAELAQAWEDEAYAAKLSSLWKLRVQAADGLVRYAESLAEIVRSGRKGAETARMLADSAAALSKDVGVVLPPPAPSQRLRIPPRSSTGTSPPPALPARWNRRW